MLGGNPGSLPKGRASGRNYRLGQHVQQCLATQVPELLAEKNPTSTRSTLPEGSAGTDSHRAPLRIR